MLVTTPALVLHTFPYGETSKIARLCTRDHGVQSVIAKGALQPKSRFGAGVQMLSEGTASFYLRSHRDLHTLSGFELVDQHGPLARDLQRYAAAVALAELVLRCSPAEPHAEIFDVLAAAVSHLETANAEDVQAIALGSLWHTASVLGFAPTVDSCARCGQSLGESAPFSLHEGGLLCTRCGRGTRQGKLRPDDRTALAVFVAGSGQVPHLPAERLAAHRRLVGRFIRRHLGEDRDLKALTFWESLT